MNDSRARILARLHGQAAPVALSSAWQSSQAFPDLPERLVAALISNKAEAHRVGGLADAVALLGQLLVELNARQVIVNDEAPFDQLDLPARLPDFDWHTVGQTPPDELLATAAVADVGITGVEAALAETGTLVISSGPGRARMTSLLPPVHIALVSELRIAIDLFEWVKWQVMQAASQNAPPPANRVFISGPSKTADIEQTLAVGVHGPKRLIVLVYPE